MRLLIRPNLRANQMKKRYFLVEALHRLLIVIVMAMERLETMNCSARTDLKSFLMEASI